MLHAWLMIAALCWLFSNVPKIVEGTLFHLTYRGSFEVEKWEHWIWAALSLPFFVLLWPIWLLMKVSRILTGTYY